MLLIDQLIEFVCDTSYDDIPQETVRFTKNLASKTVAGMLTGSTTPASKGALKYVAAKGCANQVGVIGTNAKCALEDAVFVNGISSHAAELEDDQFPAAVSDITIFPVIFPLAEKEKLTGKKLIEASAVGLEFMTRFGLFPLSSRGITELVFFGVIGAAITAGKALNLSPDQLKSAVGISIGRAGGHIMNFGTGAHYIESAGACRDGLMAALLAELGLTGGGDVERWLQDVYFGLEYDTAKMVDGLGQSPWHMHGIWVKKYPCCFLTHRHIDMMLDILAQEKCSGDDIQGVTVHVGPVDGSCDRHKPVDGEDGRFSFQHIMACLMLDGKVDSYHFTDAKVKDANYQRYWPKTQVHTHRDWPAEFQSGVAKIEVSLTNGQLIVKEKAQAKGGPDSPLQVEEFRALYDKYTGPVLSPEKIETSWQMLSNLEEFDDLSPLFGDIYK